MQRARDEHFALGAFNIDNQDTLIAISMAAKAKNAPVLVEVSQGEVDALGLQNIRDLVDNYRATYGVEMYINLDHSPSVEACKAGIEAGFEFIHIDISQANHDASEEEITASTKEVVAGSSNVHTEAIDYEEIKKTFSTPEGAINFVNATGIDTFAAAIGNLHGTYPVPKQLDLDLLKQVRDVISCNISLHGGSGTPGHFFVSAVQIGVSKININTDMRVAFRKTLEQALADNPTEYAVVKLMPQVISAVREVVESKLDMFNSAGKAQP
jgi:fructose-bisphosphate aldolase class II